MSKRRQNFQNIAWFLDIYKRELLDMDPPYQRRSVWNESYREQFIDTILLDYPAPALFLFGRIDGEGHTTFELVDGKQRLTTIFSFLRGDFPVSEESPLLKFRGRYFDSLPDDVKIAFFEYDFGVEYLPTNNEQVINGIFDRLNRNTAKLTPQELRHARFSGKFIAAAEELSVWMELRFGAKSFPRINESSRRQMKDVEIVATLLLFLDEGVKGYSSEDLDAAFSSRDREWERGEDVKEEFKSTVNRLAELAQHEEGQFLVSSRFRNQADFYSLFAAVAELSREDLMPTDDSVVCGRIEAFLHKLDGAPSTQDPDATAYYNAARSASNDLGPRTTRIRIMKSVISNSGN